jgi:chaperonin GroES
MIPRLKNLTPYKDRVIIDPISAEQKTSAGIIIPDRPDYQNGLQNYLVGVVVSKGPGCVDNNGNLSDPPLCEIGEKVFFSRAAGIPILIDSKEFLMVRSCDILAKAELE